MLFNLISIEHSTKIQIYRNTRILNQNEFSDIPRTNFSNINSIK